MNVNGLNKNLIDAASISKVSENLFSALQKKSVDYSKVDLSKFQRASLGVDLYSQKTDISFQREIAMTNSGVFNRTNIAAVQSLNAFAAQQLYANNIQEEVGGKMTIEANTADFDFISQVDEVPNYMNVFETSKDKQGSNPFSYGEFASNTEKEEA